MEARPPFGLLGLLGLVARWDGCGRGLAELHSGGGGGAGERGSGGLVGRDGMLCTFFGPMDTQSMDGESPNAL